VPSAPGAALQVNITGSSATNARATKGLIVRAYDGSQSGNLFEAQTFDGTTGTAQVTISAAGALSTTQNITVNGLTVGKGTAGVTSNTAVGIGALGNGLTTGNNNSAFGRGTLASLTIGSENVAVGIWSQNALTTGYANTTIGTNAMRTSTTAWGNTAIGIAALENNLTGSRNVALGYQAGQNETGSNKLYIAYSNNDSLIYGDFSTGRLAINVGGTATVPPSAPGAALQVNAPGTTTVGFIVNGAAGQTANLIEAKVDGGSNLFSVSAAGNIAVAGTLSTAQDITVNEVTVGRGAAGLITNTAVGISALANGLATGLNNSAFGRGTLTNLTSGSANVAVGIWSQTALTTGHSNTTIGANSLMNSTTAWGNTAIGIAALESNVTGTSNVALGYQAGQYETGSNKLYIANNNINSLIYGDFSTGRLAINVGGTATVLPSAPGAALQVNAPGTTTVGFIVNGAAGQTANLIEAKVNGGSNLFSVGAAGNTTVAGTLAVSGTSTLTGLVGIGAAPDVTAGSAHLQVTATAAANRGIVVTGAASQSGNLFEGRSSAGTVLASISPTGAGSFAGLTVTGTAGTPNVTLASLGGTVNATLPSGFNRVVVADANGLLSQVAATQLMNNTVWSLSGNGGTTLNQAALGAAPDGNFIGTTDGRHLTLVTSNVVRAQISSLGVLSTQRDLLVNGLTVGKGGSNIANNTAVGVSALAAVTTAANAVAIGYDAGKALTTGSRSIAIGSGALAKATDSFDTVAIGFNALGDATVGSVYNVAIGSNALALMTTGRNNVAVGHDAGRLAVGTGINNLNGYNSVFLGAFARASADNTTNEIVIGHSAEGIGSNAVVLGNSDITRTRLQGRVGVGMDPAGTTGVNGLFVRAGASQSTNNLLEIQNNAGTAMVQVTSDGRMGIGTAPGAGFALDVNGDIRGTNVYAGGVLLTSDARFKTNVQAITDALSIVRKLQGVSYDWNRAAYPERGFSARPQIGVLAQQVEGVLPELVSTDASGFKSVNYTGFIPVLIEGMKQQADQLDAQGERLTKAEEKLGLVEERLFKAEEQFIKLDERVGKAESFVARFDTVSEPETMMVLTPTFKVQNFTADRAYIAELRAQRIEADKARFKELDADGAVIDNVEAARLRGRVVNTGGKDLFVSYGSVAPLFEAANDGHYIVSVSAEDGSYATAQVINAGGVLRVVPTASQGIEVVANGSSVGLVAPSKKVKASWTRTG
jgi:ribosomal protein L3